MFIDFDTKGDPQLSAMLAACEKFVSDIHARHEPMYWLSLLGTSGAGKTMLAKHIIQWAKRYQKGLDPRFNPERHVKYKEVGLLKWSRCCDLMVNGDYGWIPQAKNDWLLCLDDIGVEYEKISALATSKLYDILECRRGLWTIITANLSVQQIAKRMDGRIASRLFRDGSEIIDVDVEDYNVRLYNERKETKK